MADDVRREGPGWFRVVIIGVAAAAALALIGFGALFGVAQRGYGRELATAEELDRRHGAFDAYHVAADGSVPAARMDRFLAVRRALRPRCPEVTELVRGFSAVGEYAGQPQPEAKELLGRVRGALLRLPSMGFVFGRYVAARSDELLRQGMGLGEYSWIYVASYFAMLAQPPIPVLERSGPYSLFEDRVYPAVRGAIARHVEDTRALSGPWVEELGRLRAVPKRRPFADGLPPELAASLAPYRTALADAACPAAAELDLTITVRRSGFGYDHR